MSAPSASVVVPTLGRRDSLARCLAGIAAGEVAPMEVIVVDQSQGGGLDDLLGVPPTGLGELIRLRREPHGLSVARNAGIERASGDIVLFTDDDCVPSPSWVARVVHLMAADAELAAVTGPMLPLDGDAGTVAVSSRTSMDTLEHRRGALPWTVGTGGNTAVRRSWLERVDGYDERLGVGTEAEAGEDVDLFRRLLVADGRIRYDPAAICRHERKTPEEHRRRRPAYGRGGGAALGRWLRDGDPGALRALAAWGALRGRLLVRALRHFDGRAAWDECRVLCATPGGVVHGYRLPTIQVPSTARETA